MKKCLLRISLAFVVLAGALLTSAYIYLQHPKFGELPSGDRLNRIEASPHYANGRFQNQVPTPILAGVRVLVDPVVSLSAAPIPFVNDAFEGTSIYTMEDMPHVDY